MSHIKLKEDEKFVSTTIFEGMVSIRAVIEAIESGKSDRKIVKVIYSKKSAVGGGKVLFYLKEKAAALAFPLEFAADEEISALCIGSSHGGAVMICSERSYPELPEKLPEKAFYVLLDGIEDPYNFGYALRSVYAAGADGVILPKRNWLSAAGTLCRASAGASELIDCFVCEDIAATLSRISGHGYRFVLSAADGEVSSFEADFSRPLVLGIGGEKRGFSRAITSLADLTVRLEYGREFPLALSAASATAILAFEVTRQSRK